MSTTNSATTQPIDGADSGLPKGFLLFLSALSGSCGLAWEVLYARLFSNYFGDGFVISGVVLTAVLFGIAAGAWSSARFYKTLAFVEIAIGLYAFSIVTAFSYSGFEIVSFAATPLINAVKLIVFLAIPAFLIGTCVPLFTHYVRVSSKNATRVFSKVYAVYNFGAFLSVLMIEFFLFRHLGILLTAWLVGALNLGIGLALLWVSSKGKSADTRPKPAVMNKKLGLALFVASFASGIFQLYVLKFSFAIFGPLQENFGIILASAILGVAAGSMIAMRFSITFAQVVLSAALGILLFQMFSGEFITLWTYVSGLDVSDTTELLLKIALLGGYPFALFVLFGTLVPLAVSAHKGEGAFVSGRLLAVSSLGNAFGILLMFLLLYRVMTLVQIGFLIAGLLLPSSFVAMKGRLSLGAATGGAIIMASLLFAGFQLWPNERLLLGYRALKYADVVAYQEENFDHALTYKAYDQNASLVFFKDQSRTLVLNGYRSLTFGPNSQSVLHEVIVGASPALFSTDTKEALVFGLGSGITGGATARVYQHTKIVEINPAIFNIPQHFEAENARVMHKPSADVVLEDGISTLLQDPKTYDAIVNTVTSPKYYSAAKLYTRDFYEIVKSRLAKGGVYSSWFDLNIDQDGISVMLNTLESSFGHCRYFVLARGYFNVVCSDAPLVYQSSRTVRSRVAGTGIDQVFAKYGFEEGFAATMPDLEISFGPEFLTRQNDQLNTLDLPAIEFVVARAGDSDATREMLAQTILANIEYHRKTSFGNTGWQSSCRNIAKMTRLKFSGC